MTTTKSAFRWDDPFLIENQLTDEERMIRDTANAYAQDKLQPPDRGSLSRGENGPGNLPRNGTTRPARPDDLGGLWWRGRGLRLLWPGCSRDRTRGFRLADRLTRIDS